MAKKANIFLKKIGTYIQMYEPLILLVLLVLTLRIPTLFDPHWYGDEEIYLTLGLALKKGLVFYKDIFDHKPPLIYFTAALAGSVMWFRFILAVVNAINIVYFWLLSHLILEKRPAIVASFIFGILSTIPLIEGHISNGELFMILPSTIATYLLYRSIKFKKFATSKTYLLVGFWFSIAFLFKVPIIFDFVAITIFWVLFRYPKHNLITNLKVFITSQPWLVVLGFLTPITVSIIYYASKGAFNSYVQTALLQNIGYISAWRDTATDTARSSLISNPLVWRLIIIAGLTSLLYYLRRKLSTPIIFLIIWTSFSIYGALLSNRPYPHYLIQPLVPGSLLITFIIFSNKIRDWIIGIAASIILIGFLIENGFSSYPTLPYYHQFLRFATGQINLQEYHATFPKVTKNYAIADYISKLTTHHDRIFIWGEEPAIFALSRRLPVGRYVVSFHIRDFPNGFEDTIKAVSATPPAYIIVFPDQVPEFRQLEAFIEANYILVNQIEDAFIFRLTKTSF